MKDKAIRLLIAGTFKTGQQAADWLAGTGETVTPEIRTELQKLEQERDQYKNRRRVVADYPTA